MQVLDDVPVAVSEVSSAQVEIQQRCGVRNQECDPNRGVTIRFCGIPKGQGDYPR
jgi:hypothetical protein